MEAAATKRPTDVAEAATTSAANPMASATDMAKTNTTNAAAAMEATAAGKQCVADDSSTGSNAIWTPPGAYYQPQQQPPTDYQQQWGQPPGA